MTSSTSWAVCTGTSPQTDHPRSQTATLHPHLQRQVQLAPLKHPITVEDEPQMSRCSWWEQTHILGGAELEIEAKSSAF